MEALAERMNAAIWPEPASDETSTSKKEWVAKRLLGNRLKRTSNSAAALLGIQEFFQGLGRGAVLGFSLKAGLALFFSLLKRKSAAKILSAIFSQDVMKFTRFVAVYVALIRGVNAFLATVRGTNHKSNAIVAGVVSSVAILLDDSSRRKELSLYLFCRALYVMVAMLVRKKKLPYLWWFQRFFFGIVNVPLMFAFLYEPELLDPGYYKWIKMMGNVTEEDVQRGFRDPRDVLFATGLPMADHSYQHYHQGPCATYCVKDWVTGILRAGRVYAPVHLLPLLLFKHKLLLSSPGTTLSKTAKDLIGSCLFLTTYQSLLKLNCCTFKETMKNDYGFVPVAGALSTSLATVFEKRGRVTELLLYCFPRGAATGWNWLRKRGYVHDIPGSELLFFSVASSVLLSASNEDFKPTYYKTFSFLLGSL